MIFITKVWWLHINMFVKFWHGLTLLQTVLTVLILSWSQHFSSNSHNVHNQSLAVSNKLFWEKDLHKHWQQHNDIWVRLTEEIIKTQKDQFIATRILNSLTHGWLFDFNILSSILFDFLSLLEPNLLLGKSKTNS